MTESSFVRAASLADVQQAGCMAVQVNGHTVALFAHDDEVYAMDNRCPHMGFPLDRGTISKGILTCHWHHARFDLATGGTFDQWADDARTFPVEIRDGDVWLDTTQRRDLVAHQQERLEVGLERNLSLVIGKAALVLANETQEAREPFRSGLEFGATYRRNGWGQGLTMHTCFMNLLPHLAHEDRPRALFHGLSAVASDTAGAPPRFPVRPLPSTAPDMATLKEWFRQFIEVRDAEGAERCIVSAIQAGADDRQMADMLFAAITDHRYVDIGHPADFTNKAFEALDIAGWEHAEAVLTSLVRGYAMGERMEESNAWRHPVDLIAILEDAFEELASLSVAPGGDDGPWPGREELVTVLHGDDPQAIAEGLLAALRDGVSAVQLAALVSYAAALRIAHFHTSNEFSDWDTALHTFTFANAVEQGLRRLAEPGWTKQPELLRGVFDAAMSVYLDRFLNIPATRLPQAGEKHERPEELLDDPQELLDELQASLDRQQQVNKAGALAAEYLYSGGDPERLLATLGHLLLREDRDFHTIQTVEGAFAQFQRLRGQEAGVHVLVAAARYLAAHSPTVRAQGQTYEIAYRLHRGDRIFEGP